GPRGGAYVGRADGGDPVRLGEGLAFDLSPDGRAVLSWTAVPARLTEVPVGTGFPRSIDVGAATLTPGPLRWVPPGDRIAVVGREAERSSRLWVVGRFGGGARPITPEGAAGDFAVSPDGRAVALSVMAGTVSIYPVDGGRTPVIRGPPSEALLTRGAIRVVRGLPEESKVSRWSSDGRSLFLVNQSRWPCQIRRLDLATEKLEPWRQAAPPDPTGIVSCGPIVPSGDGRSYAYSYVRCLTDIVVAEGLR